MSFSTEFFLARSSKKPMDWRTRGKKGDSLSLFLSLALASPPLREGLLSFSRRT